MARPKEAPVREGEITDTQAEESKKMYEADIKAAGKRKGARK